MDDTPVINFIARYPPRKMVFLVGAGISQNPPTTLPTVNRFVTDILDACGAEPSVAGSLVSTMIERTVSPALRGPHRRVEKDA